MNREHRLETSRARIGRPQGDEPLLVSPQGTGVLATMPNEAREEVAQLVHDLRGPISTIGLEIEMLGAADHLAMKRIVRNLEFLDRIVQDLLDSYAIDAGELEIRRVPTELRALLERVIDRVVSTRDRGRVVLEAGHGVTLDDIIAAGWPGERIQPEAAAARAYTAIKTLRRSRSTRCASSASSPT